MAYKRSGIVHRTVSIGRVNPSGRVVSGMDLGPLACCDCGFQSRHKNGCMSCQCCVFSGTGLCVRLIIRSERSYVAWCVCE